nr:hypothetical protein [Tanacetum cinerariifolium]
MSNPHQELASPVQMVFGKDSSNLLMADNLPKNVWYSTHHVTLMKSWLVQKQMALGQMSTGKEISNPFMAGVNTPRSDKDRLELMELTIFLLPKVKKVRIGVNAVDLQVSVVRNMLLLLVQKVNDVTRLQALVDKKKVVVTEATIQEALRLDDEEGVECLPNEEFFAELARMGYEKPSTKLTFYKAFFSSQWKFIIHIILQCMSAKRTSGMNLVHQWHLLSFVSLQVVEEGDTDENEENVNAGDAAVGDVSAAHGEVPTVAEEPSIPSPTPPTPPPQPPQDIPSTSQMDEEDSRALKRLNETRVEKVAKKQKLGEEVEELKRHLQIVPNEDDDVYTEATYLLEKSLLLIIRSLN